MINIDEVRDDYLRICGSHDYGLPEYGCYCSEQSDPRWAIQQLCDELEAHRQVAQRISREMRGQPWISAKMVQIHLDQLPA